MAFFGSKYFTFPALRPAKRKAQTVVEYLLVTAALLVVFVTMYRSLQWYLSRQFQYGGMIILKMYKEPFK